MACALCTRKTLSIFIRSLLKDSPSRWQLTQAHASPVVHSRRLNIRFLSKPPHTGRVRYSNLAKQHSYRLEYSYLPFAEDKILPGSRQNEHDLVSFPATNFIASQSALTLPKFESAIHPNIKSPVQMKNKYDDERIHGSRRGLKMEQELCSKSYKMPGRLARKERNRSLIAARRLANGRETNQEMSAVLGNKRRADAHINSHADVNGESAPVAKSGKNKINLDQRNSRNTIIASSRSKPEQWQVQKAAMQSKLKGQKWNPQKRLSPEALEGIRALHAQYPNQFSTPALADHFKVSPEAIRRILKSKWRPSEVEEEERLKRWDKRGERIWTSKVKQGIHPPKRWREMGIGVGSRRKA